MEFLNFTVDTVHSHSLQLLEFRLEHFASADHPQLLLQPAGGTAAVQVLQVQVGDRVQVVQVLVHLLRRGGPVDKKCRARPRW